MSIAQKFKNQVSTWAALVGMDSNNDPAALEVTNGAAHVLSTDAGQFVSQATLTATSSSQALPAGYDAAGVTRALIQAVAGTDGERLYISLDGTDALITDFSMKIAQDTTATTGPSELMIVGDLANVRLRSTTNNLTVNVWYFQ